MSESESPRDAASLLLLREGETGPEVLMGARAAGHKFMPNRLVFPGGAVDAEDFTATAASEAPAAVLERLARSGDAALARALTLAAARELEEEAGLHLGHPPDLSGLDYLCRAITPPAMKIRFDARFLVVDAARCQGSLGGSGELEQLAWFGVAEALALDLAFPTRKVLERLLLWRAETPAQRAGPVPTLLNRDWVME
jgi:8-oxo-dGTP pyrophosphatase MutT (NUDIX family)